jgi:hypothetical protein
LNRDNFDGGVDVRVGLGDSRCIPLKDGAIDAVIGSPPYCTQIDYGVATRPTGGSWRRRGRYQAAAQPNGRNTDDDWRARHR